MATLDEYKYLFKVVLVGNAGVGKTCIVRRFTQGMFPPGQGATIGVDFMIKSVEMENERIKLQIWDTAGQERFRSITQSYYRSAHALILVYDVSHQPSFDACPDWLREIESFASPSVLKVLVANKTDKEEHEIPREIGQDFANANQMMFLETSAKANENVETLFSDIALQLLHNSKEREQIGVEINQNDGNNNNNASNERGVRIDLGETMARRSRCCSTNSVSS